jgi:hypothetical protein
MFKLDLSDSFVWPFTFEYQDKGEIQSTTVKLKVKRLGIDELNTIVEKSALELAHDVLIGWQQEAGTDNDVPFEDATKQRFLNQYGVAQSFCTQYLESYTKRREKNS